MLKEKMAVPKIPYNLQMFAEDSAGLPATSTADSTPVAAGTEGGQETDPGSVSFDDMIAGNPDYKKALGDKVQEAVNNRFKHQKDLQGKLDQLNPLVEMMARRYDVAASKDGSYDLTMLAEKMMNDNSMYEEEAFQTGMSIEQVKRQHMLEAENQQLKRANEAAEQEAQSRREFEELVRQGDEVKQIYQDFDLNTEMQNEDLMRMVFAGVPLKAAYEVVHKDEILEAGMRAAVQKTKEKASAAIQSGYRPPENGLSSGSAADPGKIDPSKLEKKDFDELRRRAERGEKIVF